MKKLQRKLILTKTNLIIAQLPLSMHDVPEKKEWIKYITTNISYIQRWSVCLWETQDIVNIQIYFIYSKYTKSNECTLSTVY